MKHFAYFDYSNKYKVIVRDTFKENVYYGLDEFDCKYLKIVQSKFGCINSFRSLPDHVKMEMTPFEWNDKKQKFILNDKKRKIVQLNQLEKLVVSFS